MQQPALAQRSARFFDDFEDAEIGPPLVAGAYLLEAQGTFTDHADLGIEEVSGKLAIRGEGSIDTVLVNGRAAGWLGRSAYLSIESPLQGVVAIEASVTILEASLGGAGPTRGVMGGVLLESGSQDRLMLYFVNRGGVVGLRLSYSEGGVFNDSRGSQYLWQRGLTYKLRLELNVETGRARGFVNGSLLLEFDFFGSRMVSRAGVMACARSVGDLMEAHFDDLGLAYVVALPEGAQRIVVSRLEGERVIADVTVRSAVDGALASAHEQFDPAWSVVEVSEGGRVEDGLIWENLSSDTFSYRLQREDIYFEQQAEVSGWIEIGALSYATRGDENFGLGVKPYVNEALVTPPLLTPAGLDACYMRLQDVSPSWIGECVGVRDETIVPYEGLSYRPAFSSEWSKAIALDT